MTDHLSYIVIPLPHCGVKRNLQNLKKYIKTFFIAFVLAGSIELRTLVPPVLPDSIYYFTMASLMHSTM